MDTMLHTHTHTHTHTHSERGGRCSPMGVTRQTADWPMVGCFVTNSYVEAIATHIVFVPGVNRDSKTLVDFERV